MLEVEIDVLDKNNRLAERNRRALLPASNWCSTWFPALVPENHPADGNFNAPERQRSVRGIEGDQQTVNDAARIRATGTPQFK